MRQSNARRLAALGLALAALATAGCPQGVRQFYADTVFSGETITYQQYLDQDQYADPRPTVDDILRRLGEPLEIVEGDGFRRKVVYRAFDLQDDFARAEFIFDRDERLMKKEMW